MNTNKPVFRLVIDSGAHSQNKVAVKKAGVHAHKAGATFAYTKEFMDYVDAYCEYVKKHNSLFDFYVSVDVIFNPQRSWEVQKYIEENHGLRPIPVYHFGEDVKWIKKYMDEYDYIGMGGMGQTTSKRKFIPHADKAFKILSDDKGKVLRKIHGFAVTSIDMMVRYPFYSVDSSSWVQFSQYGMIILPKKKGKTYDYLSLPAPISLTTRCKTDIDRVKTVKPLLCRPNGAHTYKYSEKALDTIRDYIESEGFILGESVFEKVPYDYQLQEDEKFLKAKDKSEDRIVEKRIVRGICNDHELRDKLNYLYFLRVQERLPHETIIYMGGNFDLLVYKHKEQRMMDFVRSKGYEYNRMISYYFNNKCKNILEIKETDNGLQEVGVEDSVTCSKPRRRERESCRAVR